MSSTRSGLLGTDAETFLLAKSSAQQFNLLASTMASAHRAWQLRDLLADLHSGL